VVHRDHRYRVQDVVHFTQEEPDWITQPVLQVCAIDPETCGTAEPDSGHD
jgi:hypothetical protein